MRPIYTAVVCAILLLVLGGCANDLLPGKASSEPVLGGAALLDSTLKCAQLYEMKQARYWGNEIGNNRFTFNSKLQTCIAMNIHNDSQRGRYSLFVIDVVTDKNLVSLSQETKNPIGYSDGDRFVKCEQESSFLTYVGSDGKEIDEMICDDSLKSREMLNKALELVKSYGLKI